MRLLTVFLFLFIAAPQPARAADNMIVIKNKDGSVTKYEIPEESRNRPVPVPERAEPEPQPRIQLKSEQPPQQEAVKQEEQPAVAEQEQQPAAEPAPEKTEYAPVKQEQQAAEAEKAEIKKEAVKEIKKEKVARGPSIPIPGRKPLLQQQVLETARKLPPDMAIPRNLAVSIAIKHAPPARDFQVLREMHDGIPVYAVVFKTEDGPHTVMVDARNGEVVSD